MDKIERPTEPVKITLRDGRERELRFPLSKVRAAKAEFGASLLRGQALMDLDEDRLPKLLWYGLSSHDPGLTPEQVENLVDMADLPYVMVKFSEAWNGPQKKQDTIDQVAKELIETASQQK